MSVSGFSRSDTMIVSFFRRWVWRRFPPFLPRKSYQFILKKLFRINCCFEIGSLLWNNVSQYMPYWHWLFMLKSVAVQEIDHLNPHKAQVKLGFFYFLFCFFRLPFYTFHIFQDFYSKARYYLNLNPYVLSIWLSWTVWKSIDRSPRRSSATGISWIWLCRDLRSESRPSDRSDQSGRESLKSETSNG